jgi:hypothetical protein
MTIGLATPVRNALLDAITTQAGTSALLRIYDGTRPATGGTATNKLAELACSSALGAASAAGVLTLNPISSAGALLAGTATWFRIVKADGTTVIMDGSVGTTGSDINLNSTVISAGATVSVTSGAITAGNP